MTCNSNSSKNLSIFSVRKQWITFIWLYFSKNTMFSTTQKSSLPLAGLPPKFITFHQVPQTTKGSCNMQIQFSTACDLVLSHSCAKCIQKIPQNLMRSTVRQKDSTDGWYDVFQQSAVVLVIFGKEFREQAQHVAKVSRARVSDIEHGVEESWVTKLEADQAPNHSYSEWRTLWYRLRRWLR